MKWISLEKDAIDLRISSSGFISCLFDLETRDLGLLELILDEFEGSEVKKMVKRQKGQKQSKAKKVKWPGEQNRKNVPRRAEL